MRRVRNPSNELRPHGIAASTSLSSARVVTTSSGPSTPSTTAYPFSSSRATTSSTLASTPRPVTVTLSPNSGGPTLEPPDQEVGRPEERLAGGLRERGVARERGENGLGDAHLDAVEDREPRRPEGRHVVADLVGEVHDVRDALRDVGTREPGDAAGHRLEGVDVGEDGLPAGTQDPRDLPHDRLQVGHVGEGERACDYVDA